MEINNKPIERTVSLNGNLHEKSETIKIWRNANEPRGTGVNNLRVRGQLPSLTTKGLLRFRTSQAASHYMV